MSDQNKTKKELLDELQSLRATLQFQNKVNAQAMDTHMIASAMDAILAIDEHQNIVQFNGAAEQIFGYKMAEVLGKSVHMLLPGHFREAHLKHVDSYIATGVSSRNTHSLGTLTGLRANG